MRDLVPLLASALGAITLSACMTTPDEPAERGEPSGAAYAAADLAIAVGSDPGIVPDLCNELAAELTQLLAAAQSCNVAAANPIQCATWVPSLDGCQQPVAYAGADATKAYLDLFERYADSCPLPDRPCVDPLTLAVDCTQAADLDSLVGRCAIIEQP